MSFKNSLISQALKIRNFINRHPTIHRPRLAMTLATRDEADILERFFLFHKAMGVDLFVVTDNGSVDQTCDILKKYEQLGWITKIFTQPGRFHQELFVDRMIRYISDHDLADWVINSDSDEFWVPLTGTLKDKLECSHANVVTCSLHNIIPIIQADPMLNVLAVVDPTKINSGPLSIFSPNINKVIHRVKGYSKIHDGNHNVVIRQKSVEYSKDIFVLHYAVRSLSHFKRKFDNLSQNKLTKADHAFEYKRRRELGESPEQIFQDYLHLSELQTFKNLGYISDVTKVRDFFFPECRDA